MAPINVISICFADWLCIFEEKDAGRNWWYNKLLAGNWYQTDSSAPISPENCESGSLIQWKPTHTVFPLLNVAMPSLPGWCETLPHCTSQSIPRAEYHPRMAGLGWVDLKSRPAITVILMVDHGCSLCSLLAVDTPDPYVTLSIPSAPDGRRQTRAIKDNKNPEWNQTFEFVIDPELNNNLSTYDTLSTLLINLAI